MATQKLDYVWNRLYREGSSEFTFEQALDAVIRQCENELRLFPEDCPSIPEYKNVLQKAKSDYIATIRTAQEKAEKELIAKWRESGDEELNRIADIFEDGAYDQLVF